MNILKFTQELLRNCLQLDQSLEMNRDTPLLGGFPEFNSLTITALIIDIEETFDCEVEDEEITAEIFETVGSLSDFIGTKVAGA